MVLLFVGSLHLLKALAEFYHINVSIISFILQTPLVPLFPKFGSPLSPVNPNNPIKSLKCSKLTHS